MNKAWLAILFACSSPASAPTISGSKPAPKPGGVYATQISTAANHTCARMSDGTVRCWGDNMLGAVGDGTMVEERHTPVTVKGIADAISVHLGLAQSCARLANDDVWCWGSLTYLDTRERTGPTRWPDDARDIVPRAIPELAGADQLWFSHTGNGCVRWTELMKMQCWGSGGAVLATGQETYGTSLANVSAELRDVLDISVGENHGCAVMDDRTVTCWGRNDQGALGDGMTLLRLKPKAVKNLRDVAQVVVSREATCARLVDGRVSCWGGNHWGQLGDWTTKDRSTPAFVDGVRDVVELVASSVHFCALHRGGTVTCWGNNRQGLLGDGHDFEHRGPRRAGDEDDASGPVTTQIDRVTQLAAADFHTCALRDDGTVWCWGSGQRGSLGDGFAADRRVPTQVKWEVAPVVSAGLPKGVTIRDVAVGHIHTCAALSDGSARCWGRNDGGMVDATTSGGQHVRPVVVKDLANVQAVSLDLFGSFAKLADGTITSWGRDTGLEQMGMKPVVDFIAGGMLTCVRRADGVSRCGDNDGVFEAPNTLAVGVEHAFACVLLVDHTVACAGYNGRGQLGDGTTNDRKTFAPVVGLKDVAQIAVGGDHACARLKSGSVKCWGDGNVTGDGSTTGPLEKPVDVPITNVVDLVAGGQSTCARLASGKVSCWGFYATQNMSSPREAWYAEKPRDVAWLAGATQIFLGSKHHCALFAADKLKCWGENDAGQLGDGTMTNRDVPVGVQW